MHKIDEVFGYMTYKHSWVGHTKVEFFGQEKEVEVIAKAYSGEDILDSQRENFKKFKDYLAQNVEKIIVSLQDYCDNIYQVDMAVYHILDLRSIYFGRKGEWGLLFESACDVEDGLCLMFEGDNMIIDTQGALL